MTQLYVYKLTVDDGGAPCTDDGLLSLAICKPMIRTASSVGDWVFGFAANSLFSDNRLLYIAKLTSKVGGGRYYIDSRFRARADCIYRRSGREFQWRKRALYHGESHLEQDLGKPPYYVRAQVILSTDFRYLGTQGSDDYKSAFPAIRRTVESLGQGHRVNHPNKLSSELLALKDEIWRTVRRRVSGEPATDPRKDRSHRGGSCTAVEC